MGYDIRIQRTPGFTLDEWKAAVESTEGVRLNAGKVAVRNPKTGEVVSIPGMAGDAEVDVDGHWIPCFRWRPKGFVVFCSDPDFMNPESKLRKLARGLGEKLNATLCGQEGEIYT
jgi:hypothetical protein